MSIKVWTTNKTTNACYVVLPHGFPHPWQRLQKYSHPEDFSDDRLKPQTVEPQVVAPLFRKSPAPAPRRIRRRCAAWRPARLQKNFAGRRARIHGVVASPFAMTTQFF